MLPVHCGAQKHAGLCLGQRPCTGRRWVQGRSQSTTPSASDLHNARATTLNSFHNMEYKIIKEIRQNTTWIEADILSINLTANRHNALAPAIVYVSNDVTIATQRTLLWAHVNETKIAVKSTDRRSNLSPFLYVQRLIHGCLIVFIYIKVIRWNCFSNMWRISLPRILQDNDLQCSQTMAF